MKQAINRHATAIVLGATGFLIEGQSGSGKTSLALAAIQAIRGQNSFAAMVADDQCLIESCNGRLIATCPPVLSGITEMRNLGIIKCPALSSAVIDIVIKLVPHAEIERMPEPKSVEIAGVKLPLYALPRCQTAVSMPIMLQIFEQRRF